MPQSTIAKSAFSQMLELDKIHLGDNRQILKSLPAESVHTCVTSPPYFGLRDYGMADQIGLEATPEAFVQELVEVFREVKRVLRKDGTLWLNIGDSYGKNKQLLGIPWRVAFALQADGWILRQEIIWSKSNPMPEPVKDRCVKSHEQIFLLSKSTKYAFDFEAIKEPLSNPNRTNFKSGAGVDSSRNDHDKAERSKTQTFTSRNKRSVWTTHVGTFKGVHSAVFPESLIEPCILAGAPDGGIVLDPFMGSGTTAAVAQKHGRSYIGCELNPIYRGIAEVPVVAQRPKALKNVQPDLFAQVG